MKKQLALAVMAFSVSGQLMAEVSNAEILQKIEQQQAEIERLKQQLKSTDKKVEVTANAVENSSSTYGNMASWAANTQIGGYGEHHFNHFEESDDKVDAHRFVMFLGHKFSDKVKMFSEIELEHGLSGEGKPGEVELEQAYIQYDYAQNHRIIGGQFLLPVGLLNETHEPETFYGTERNPVEKNIIPTTWWETGAMLQGEIATGFTYDVALHSGLKLKTDNDAVRKGRQKSAKATAEDLAVTARVKYTGVKGLTLAATLQQQQDLTQGTREGGEALLLALNAAYEINGFNLKALWASWDIDGASFEANGSDEQTGWYVEAGYKFSDRFGVFVRQNQWDNAAGNSTDSEYSQTDVGMNYWLHERVVVKLDYSDIDTPKGKSDNDSLNLGLGWSF